jgi:hypothetical protein
MRNNNTTTEREVMNTLRNELVAAAAAEIQMTDHNDWTDKIDQAASDIVELEGGDIFDDSQVDSVMEEIWAKL